MVIPKGSDHVHGDLGPGALPPAESRPKLLPGTLINAGGGRASDIRKKEYSGGYLQREFEVGAMGHKSTPLWQPGISNFDMQLFTSKTSVSKGSIAWALRLPANTRGGAPRLPAHRRAMARIEVHPACRVVFGNAGDKVNLPLSDLKLITHGSPVATWNQVSNGLKLNMALAVTDTMELWTDRNSVAARQRIDEFIDDEEFVTRYLVDGMSTVMPSSYLYARCLFKHGAGGLTDILTVLAIDADAGVWPTPKTGVHYGVLQGIGAVTKVYFGGRDSFITCTMTPTIMGPGYDGAGVPFTTAGGAPPRGGGSSGGHVSFASSGGQASNPKPGSKSSGQDDNRGKYNHGGGICNIRGCGRCQDFADEEAGRPCWPFGAQRSDGQDRGSFNPGTSNGSNFQSAGAAKGKRTRPRPSSNRRTARDSSDPPDSSDWNAWVDSHRDIPARPQPLARKRYYSGKDGKVTFDKGPAEEAD